MKIEETCSKARAAAAQLGANADEEQPWIARLERSADEIGAAIEAANSAATEAGFSQAQRLVRLQLSHLNRQISDTANKFSLDELIRAVPLEITREASFVELAHAIRDLKATVMARALVHRIWQDAENEFSLIEDVLNTPAKSVLSKIQQHWLLLRTRVLWLASIDRDPALKAQAEDYSKKIETELFKETLSDAMKASFADFYRLLMRNFFKVDAELKEDCKSLEKFRAPLSLMVEEIGNA